MRTRLWASIIIFISSYSPMAIIFAIRDFIWPIGFQHNTFILLISLLSLFSLFILKVTIFNITDGHIILVKKVTNKSSEIVNYTIPYIVSFLSLNLSSWQDIFSFFLFMSLLCILTVKTQCHFINPILALNGYGLYEVEFEEGNITKNGVYLSSYELNSNEYYTMQKLSKYLYFITKKIKQENDDAL